MKNIENKIWKKLRNREFDVAWDIVDIKIRNQIWLKISSHKHNQVDNIIKTHGIK
jgi:hypothetical protein